MLTDIAYAIGEMLDGKMHQTTVRFGPDLWRAVEEECRQLGVSVAQYLREAALARLAFTAGRRGLPDYELALARSAGPDALEFGAMSGGEPAAVLQLDRTDDGPLDGNRAVTAQNRLARQRSREIREDSARLRELVQRRRTSR